MVTKIKKIISSSVVLTLVSLLVLARGTFAWDGELQIEKDCEAVSGVLKINPDSQVVEAKINGVSTRQLDLDWQEESEITFEAFISWDTGETWSETKTVSKPAECEEPSPTPTPTPTLTPTPSITPTPTLTPTPGPEPEQARCSGLSVSPEEGTAPLTVKFTGSGFDKNGPILEYEFDFGDASSGQPQIWKQKESDAAHKYEYPGTYVASLKVKDQGGQWRDGSGDCKKTITVNSKPQVLGTTTGSRLPETGIPSGLALGFLPLGLLGLFFYRHFKIL